MSESPLFKRAYTRGLNAELTRRGVALYPTKEAADYAADWVADNSGMPDPLAAPEQITEKVAGLLCDQLVKAGHELCRQAGNKYDPSLSKTASSVSPEDRANADALSLMQKAAAETGSLVTGGTQENTLAAAASSNDEAALEQMRRAQGYANLGEQGVGGYEDKGVGSVGVEHRAPEAPGATGTGTNSAIENTNKMGALAEIIRKTAGMGSLLTPGGDANTLAAAATHNGEAALEAARRPEGYAHMGEDGVGNTKFVVPAGAVVGREVKPNEAPKATGSGTNSVIEFGKSAFDQLFESTARDVVQYLPEKMADNQKVAHVRAMMGLDTDSRAAYLRDMYNALGAKKEASELVSAHYTKTAAAKVAGMENLPPALRENAEKMRNSKSDSSSDAKPFEGKETPAEEALEHKAMLDKSASLSDLRAALARLNA